MLRNGSGELVDAVMKQRVDEGVRCKKKLIEFNSNIAGITAVHPEYNPQEWPAPHGTNVYKPPVNPLRESFTNKLTKEELLEYYISLINRIMLHKCKIGYCLDPKKLKTVTFTDENGEPKKTKKMYCRFNFPFEFHGFEGKKEENSDMLEKVVIKPITDEEMAEQKLEEFLREISDPTIHGSECMLGSLQLLRNHPTLVAHIVELLVIWAANTDQKTITSYQQVLNYILKYVMKPEKASEFLSSITKSICKKLDDNDPVRRVAIKALMESIGQRDWQVNECMLICHNLPYVKYSRQPRIANLKGSSKVKANLGNEGDKVVESDNWQDKYWNRENLAGYKKLCSLFDEGKFHFKGKHPKDISLREFMKNFSKSWVYKPENVFPHFVPTYKWVVHHSSNNYEEYCKTLLLQDKPGCYFSNVGKNFESCAAELKDFVENSEFCPDLVKQEYYESLSAKREGRKKKDSEMDGIEDLHQDDMDNEADKEFDHFLDIYNEFAKNPVNEEEVNYDDDCDQGSDYGDGVDPNDTDWSADANELELNTTATLRHARRWLEIEKRTFEVKQKESKSFKSSSLNKKQKIAFDIVIAWANQKAKNPKTPPRYINISGRGGCGKSHFLNTVKQYIHEELKLKNFMKIAAPTANAAFIVDGTTLHSLLKIPPKISIERGLPELRGEALRQLQDEFKNVELLVIDEKSMVGLHMLNMIHLRLTEIKACKDLFGGISLILMGDFAQLPPVKDQPLFYNISEGVSNDYQLHGMAHFQKYFEECETIIFDEIMRQKGEDQKRFKECLNNLADGSFDRSDWEYLKQRDLMSSGNFSNEEKKDFLRNSTMLCSTNKAAIQFNLQRIKQLGTPIAQVNSDNNCSEALNSGFNKSGLSKQTLLAKGCEVLITSNLWKETGLTNGARGVVKYIIYEEGTKPPMLPAMVILEVEQYTGPAFLGLDKCVPIIPVTRTWYHGGKLCTRTMLPLNLGYAMTIHKSQGMSLGKTIINIGNREFACGLTYTAISRCRKIEDLVFLPFYNYVRFTSIRNMKMFKARKLHDVKEKEKDKALSESEYGNE